MMETTLIVPGLNGSGPDHWQSWFQRQIPDCVRVIQSDWSDPDLPRWSAKLRREVNRVAGRVIVVAHSFGCLAAVQTAFDYPELVAGLMLVAPADPARFALDRTMPARPLGVPSVLVASTSDPWMSFGRACDWAHKWGAQLINLGAVGHINVASGHGEWTDGLAIYNSLHSEVTRVPRWNWAARASEFDARSFAL
jgi:predicted alpha/beta hydrolase family esterase